MGSGQGPLRAQGQPARPFLEPEPGEQRREPRPHRRLAVNLFQREPLDRAAVHVLDERGERRLEPLILGSDEYLKRLAAALEVDNRLTGGEHDIGARRPGGLASLTLAARRPGQRGAIRLGWIDGGEHKRWILAIAQRAQPLDRAR